MDDLFATHDALAVGRAGQGAQDRRPRAARRHARSVCASSTPAERHHGFLRRRAARQVRRGGGRGAVPGRALRREAAHGRLRRHADDAGLEVLRRTAGRRGRQRRRGAHAPRRAGDRGPQQHQRVRPGADDGAGLRRRDGAIRGARICRRAARPAARRRSLRRAACRWRMPPTAAARSASRRRCAACSG